MEHDNLNIISPVKSINHQKTYSSSCSNGNHLSSQYDVSLSTQEKLKLSSWGLPQNILEFYKSKGIIHMFEWQVECLSLEGVLDSSNLVYSAPTSAGKTLVAEILISKTLFEVQKKALVILPFVSVVREKMFYFQGMYASSGVNVEGYMGGHTPSVSFNQVNLAVCTIEKANAIINRLLEEHDLQNLGLVVVDELHLLGDPYRGYLLELLLTKLKYISLKSNFEIQIIGMSATLPNLKSLADWLQANLYYTNFRPVPLKEKLKCGTAFYDKQLIKLSELTVLPSEASDDSENVGQLCVETIANGHSVLIFCPTKVWCENLADKIALFFRRNGCSKSAEIEGTFGYILRKQLNLKKINEVIEYLKMSPVGLDNDLHKTIAYGVAFHHAGLTLDERDIIEGSFRQGAIRVLCATSTLSSGVNLPARRVIIRSPMSFGGIMDILTYRQMIGRAGRMGVDSEGESILICKPNEKALCQSLMCSTLKPIESCLGHGRLSASLKRALLEIIASGVASSPEDVKQYANCTFLAFNSRHNIEDPIKSCIDFLEENEFIRLQENGTIFTPTPLGKACLASSLPPDEGLALFRELQRARRCFVLDTDLHIIYQVTPYSVSEQWSKVDWLNVLNMLENLPPSMKRVGEMVGVEESFLVRVAKGRININDPEIRNKLSIHRRFFTSLALQDLINEIPLSVVAEKFECNKGMLQSLQQSAATYAGMVTEFTKNLGWSSVELIFSQFKERLQFGIQRELCDLMRLPLLNAMRARVLFDAGFTSLAAIANANVSDLENVFFSMAPFQSKKEIAGETTYDKDKRVKLEAIWVTGKSDITIPQAAELLLCEARNILELELGLEGVKWGRKDSSKIKESTARSINTSVNKSMALLRTPNATSIVENRNNSHLNEKQNKTGNDINFNENGDTFANKEHTNNEKNIVCDTSVSNAEQNVPVKFDCIIKPTKNKIESEVANGFGNNKSNDKVSLEQKFDNDAYQENILIKTSGNGEVNALHLKNVSFGGIGQIYTNKDELNFTSSFIFDMVPDYVTEELSDILKENSAVVGGEDRNNENIARNDDANLVSHNADHHQSVEILSDSKVHCSSKILSLSRLSEDMFDKEAGTCKTMSTPIQSESIKKSNNSGKNQIYAAEISSPDLFGQSLTFDSEQAGRVFDFKKEFLEEPQVIVNPSISLNSDDLGFVSDLSPQKIIQTKRKFNVPLEKNNEESEIHLHREKDPELSLSFVEKLMKTEVVGEDMGREAVKRKIDSPDLIIDSGDDSSTELRRLNKRMKRNVVKAQNTKSLVDTKANDSDDETMTTPKIRHSELLDVSNIERPCCGSMKSFNRSFMKANQRKRKLSQNIGKSKRNSSQPKRSLIQISKVQIKERKPSAIDTLKLNKTRLDKINVIDVCEEEKEFKLFREKMMDQSIVGLALGCRRRFEEKKRLIGSKIVKNKKNEISKLNLNEYCYKETVLDGIAFYWKGKDVYYMSLDDRIVPVIEKINFIKSFCHIKNTFRIFDVKEQIKMLFRCCSVLLTSSFQDPKVGFWLLSEKFKEKNFLSIALQYLPEAKNLISQLGSAVGFSSPGLLNKSSTSHKIRACIEAYLTYHMMDQQLPLLHAAGLEQAFVQIEMPIMICLADMELHGFQICRKTILDIKERLDSIKEALEERANYFAGHKFPLYSSASIRKVLFKELNLDGKDNVLTKKRKLISMSKQVLESLWEETKHPLLQIILQWRKTRLILSKFVLSFLQISLDSDRIFGISQTYTLTGRISMHEPNLQNTPKSFKVEFDDGKVGEEINLRDIFVASENCLLIAADYCQIELRMLSHLSGDTELVKNIIEADDIFINIAANIYGIPIYQVDEVLRERAKQTCYGMIYGIGSKTLSQELGINEEDAIVLLENFKNKYTGVKNFMENTISDCQKNGFVTTLLGRRRYLPAIKDPNRAVRAEAERQAINTTVQGSAADLMKTAMITWREKIQSLVLPGVIVHPVLHLHDELIFEVQKEAVEAVAVILKETMESAMELIVPTPVKIKIGSSWGQLKIFEN